MPVAAAFGKQLRRADRQGAAWAVVIGDEEAAAGEALLKDLRRAEETGAEGGAAPERAGPGQRLSLGELPETLARLLAG